ncbi:hypothetical protein Mapa_014541 [Marchantia paleacea]|nr:hypothetical protein Mapa_014541 [Marchantia paleacea]
MSGAFHPYVDEKLATRTLHFFSRRELIRENRVGRSNAFSSEMSRCGACAETLSRCPSTLPSWSHRFDVTVSLCRPEDTIMMHILAIFPSVFAELLRDITARRIKDQLPCLDHLEQQHMLPVRLTSKGEYESIQTRKM